jgi:glycosyltransferase involved in cell wall biosynthesis
VVTPRRRILLVKPVLPYPPDQGTRVVSTAIIEALSAAHDVTVLARVLDASEFELARELEKRCARVVTVFPRNRRGGVARVAYRTVYVMRSFFTGRSLKSLYDCPGAFLEYWQLYPLLDVFPAGNTVLLTHDIDLMVNADRARLEESLLGKARALRRWRTEARDEVRAYRRARNIWALTARDAQAAHRLSGGSARASVLPFGLREACFAPAVKARDSREVLFLGAMGAAFNRDALGYFARDVYPLLAGIDGIRFTVVGGALPGSLAFFGALRHVEVTGHVRDVSPFLSRCACMVVPIRYGGGLRIRILEAIAAGVPVVASPVAIEGMQLEAGRHVLVASSPADYRAHIERVFTDRPFVDALLRDAQAHVRETYGPVARTDGIRRAAGALMEGGGGAVRRVPRPLPPSPAEN